MDLKPVNTPLFRVSKRRYVQQKQLKTGFTVSAAFVSSVYLLAERLTFTAWQRPSWRITASCLCLLPPSLLSALRQSQQHEWKDILWTAAYTFINPHSCSLRPRGTPASTDASQTRGHDVHQRCSAVCCCVRGREDGEGVKEQKQTADVIQAGGLSHPHSSIQMTYCLSLCLSRFSCRPRRDVLTFFDIRSACAGFKQWHVWIRDAEKRLCCFSFFCKTKKEWMKKVFFCLFSHYFKNVTLKSLILRFVYWIADMSCP